MVHSCSLICIVGIVLSLCPGDTTALLALSQASASLLFFLMHVLAVLHSVQ